MRIRITKDRIRVCPACRYLCLKLEDEFLYEEFEDENLNICSDCNEAFVAAIPDEYFAKLATPVTNPVTRNSSPDSCGPTSQMSLFDAEIISSELTELEPIEISDSTQ